MYFATAEAAEAAGFTKAGSRKKKEEGRLMGQKVNPYGFRLGVTTEWKSRWFADRREYADNVIEDWQIRDYLMNGAALTRPSAESRSSGPVID